VRLAIDGEPLPRPGAGVVLMPPANVHLLVEGGRVRLRDGPERHCCRPSVDVLFESVAREIGDRAIACLLTGMGADGAAGLLAIRRAGGETIAQDKETSRIYGMPQVAAELGAAASVLPLDGIAPALVRAACFAEEQALR
jgi:two-component system chemotaxis response regulator CheB